jgi:uncharacterized protein involved in exopolysaccharide biosynthesis
VIPSRNDPRVRVTEIATPSEFRRPVSEEKEGEPQRIVWMRLLWSERRFLLRAGVTGLVLSLVVALLLPRRYESQTRLMPPEQQGSGLAMLAALATKGGGGGSDSSSSSSSDGGLSGGLSRVATDFLGLKTSGALLVDILHGPTVQDSLIQKFDLRSLYHVRYWQDARKRLDDHTTIKEDRKSGIISIAVSDRDPREAQEMAKAYVEALNTLLAQVSTSSARRERMFLEQRLKSAKDSLDAASQQFSAYASKTGALDVPSQTKAMVESEAALQGQLIAAESELEGLQQIYTDNNVRVRTLKARIAGLRQQVENFSGNKGDPNSPSQITGDLPSLRKLPLVGVRWANLYRETKIEEAVYEMLTQEYEFAKIQEAKEIPTVNVVDAALFPEKTSFPPRALITLLGAFLSFLLAGVFVISAAMWKESESHEKRLATEIWAEITAENTKSQAVLRQVWNRFGGRNGHH